MKNQNNDYEVGYKKPPHNTKFKPGKSGNPKGRPRSSQTDDIDMMIYKELNRMIPINENGQIKKIPLKHAMVKGHSKQIIEGKSGAVKSLEEFRKFVKRNDNSVKYLLKHPPKPPVSEETRKYALAHMEELAERARKLELEIMLEKQKKATS